MRTLRLLGVDNQLIGAIASVCGLLAVSGCSAVPNLPRERDFPVQEIITNTVCELRNAFHVLSNKHLYPAFQADEWAGSISLVPKVDTDLNSSFGLTGKDTLVAALRFWSWAGSPLVAVDIRGHTDASATYAFHTSNLLKANKQLDETCLVSDWDRSSAHRAGILEWWERAVPTKGNAFGNLVPMDKQGFTREVIVKFSAGTASATYTVMPHTFTFGASAYYQRDLTLSFAFTPDPKKFRTKVVTLPEGGLFREIKGVDKGPVSPGALMRLDAIQTDNILRNLRFQTQ